MVDVVIPADEEGDAATASGSNSNSQPLTANQIQLQPPLNNNDTSNTQPSSHQQSSFSTHSTTAPNHDTEASVDPQEQFRSLQALWDNDREPEDLVSTFTK